MYKIYVCFSVILYFLGNIHSSYGQSSRCGCKSLRPCYQQMLDTLLDRDETACIEDTSMGASTLLIFLSALSKFCPTIIQVNHEHLTYEGRYLYEVIIERNKTKENDKAEEEKAELKPVLLMEAGQEGDTESVGFALYVVEQLVACMEYQPLIDNVRWVILPCTNPDGQEYNRYSQVPWKKNMKPSEGKLSYGVDITRNFDSHWGACTHSDTSFSPNYPGPKPVSENETIFIKDILTKYKDEIKIYVSIRGDGHSIQYPYGHTDSPPSSIGRLSKVANEVTTRVNQRAGSIHLFVNNSIHESEGKPHCGHSVDYALDSGIPLAYEMLVFLGSENRIMTKFQSLPRGYENSLRNGYFSGIRELYNAITNEKKYGKF